MNKRMICFVAVAAIATCGLVHTVRAEEIEATETECSVCEIAEIAEEITETEEESTEPEIYISGFDWTVADLVCADRIINNRERDFEMPRHLFYYDVNDDGHLDGMDYDSIYEWVSQTSLQYDYWISHEEFWLPQLYDLLWQYQEDTGTTPEQLKIGVGFNAADWLEGSNGSGKHACVVCFSEAYFDEEKNRCFGYDFSAQDPWYNGIGYEKSLGIMDGDIVMSMEIWYAGTQELDFMADRYDAVIERRE